jgi:hypothetical protein
MHQHYCSAPRALFSSILQADQTACRFAALTGAIILYGALGSPSPDHPGIVEILIGVLLVLGAGAPGLRAALVFQPSWALWRKAGWFLLVWGAVVSFPAAVLQGNDPRQVVRDIPAFLFLLLPLFAGDIFEKRPDYFKPFLCAFTAAGFIFALRSLGETSFFNTGLSEDARELYYFANAPGVLLAATLPAGLVLERYLRTLSLRDAGFLIVAGIAALIPMLALALTLQRASIGWACVCFGLFILAGIWRAPYRLAFLLALAVLAFLPLRDYFFTLLEMLSHKTAVYGVNKRELEMEAVWERISDSFLSNIFGLGWGGMFESPAVGGVRVNYTHNFFSGLLLKTGIPGAVAGLIYISGFFIALARLFSRHMILAVALAGPLAIDAVLYASYKWLDFGLMLLLITAAAQLHRPAGYCIHKG